MRKYHTDLREKAPARQRSNTPRLIGLALAILIAPLAYELGMVLLANWQSMTGAHWEPDTPILRTLTDWSRDANVEFRRNFYRVFNSGPWRPSMFVPIAIIWAAMMSVVFLRRVR